jgi:HEAT repeat protein
MLGPPPLPRTLEASIRDLDSMKPEVRLGAAEDLVRHAKKDDAVRARAIPLLERRLSDDHPRVRGAAAVALGDLEAKEAVPAILAAAGDADGYVRQMALNALGEIADARALPLLRRSLRDPRPEVRYQAVIAFARVEKDAAKIDQALLDATNDEDDAVVHIALRVAEERMDHGHALDARLSARARALVAQGSPHLVVAGAILLAKSGDEAGHDVVLRIVRGERIHGEAPEKEDEQAAVELAGALGLEAARPALERRAWGLGAWVRDTCKFHAKIALARMGHPRAIAEIMKDLSSTRPDVLGAAVVAAGRARIAAARPILAKLTAAAVDAELLREALGAIDEASGGTDGEEAAP